MMSKKGAKNDNMVFWIIGILVLASFVYFGGLKGEVIQTSSILHPDLGLVTVTAEKSGFFSQFFSFITFPDIEPVGWSYEVLPGQTHTVLIEGIGQFAYSPCPAGEQFYLELEHVWYHDQHDRSIFYNLKDAGGNDLLFNCDDVPFDLTITTQIPTQLYTVYKNQGEMVPVETGKEPGPDGNVNNVNGLHYLAIRGYLTSVEDGPYIDRGSVDYVILDSEVTECGETVWTDWFSYYTYTDDSRTVEIRYFKNPGIPPGCNPFDETWETRTICESGYTIGGGINDITAASGIEDTGILECTLIGSIPLCYIVVANNCVEVDCGFNPSYEEYATLQECEAALSGATTTTTQPPTDCGEFYWTDWSKYSLAYPPLSVDNGEIQWRLYYNPGTQPSCTEFIEEEEYRTVCDEGYIIEDSAGLVIESGSDNTCVEGVAATTTTLAPASSSGGGGGGGGGGSYTPATTTTTLPEDEGFDFDFELDRRTLAIIALIVLIGYVYYSDKN